MRFSDWIRSPRSSGCGGLRQVEERPHLTSLARRLCAARRGTQPAERDQNVAGRVVGGGAVGEGEDDDTSVLLGQVDADAAAAVVNDRGHEQGDNVGQRGGGLEV